MMKPKVRALFTESKKEMILLGLITLVFAYTNAQRACACDDECYPGCCVNGSCVQAVLSNCTIGQTCDNGCNANYKCFGPPTCRNFTGIGGGAICNIAAPSICGTGNACLGCEGCVPINTSCAVTGDLCCTGAGPTCCPTANCTRPVCTGFEINGVSFCGPCEIQEVLCALPGMCCNPATNACETCAPTQVPTQAPTNIVVSNCSLCTFTQGGYGTKCPGNKPLGTCQQLVEKWSSSQPGCLLEACLNSSITLGNASNGGKTVTFTNAAAIENFLPASGPPSIFKVSAVNPTSTSAGVFAGQLLTAILNIQFSGADGNLIFFNTKCNILPNYTINQVIFIANQVISGSHSYPQFPPTLLNEALTLFNEAFDGCRRTSVNCSCFTCEIPGMFF
jgi:hypothetical protein